MRWEFDDNQLSQVRLFYALFHLFVGTMLLAVTTDNLGLMWVAIEGTTLATVFLVNLHNNKTGLEAAYKYLIISSVGIALAFLGTVLMYYAAVGQTAEIGLSWTALIGIAARLNPTVVKLAFAFILVGYGTKAGLAPMHTWLPDAHSEAPSPMSAMMSGVLLAVAMYAIARWKTVVDGAVDPRFTGNLLIGFGLLSVAIGAFSLVIQRHYKRMLAYSSVEHMGLVSIGLALGPLGVFASWLHVVNHAVAKSMSFLLAGRVLHRYQTTEIDQVTGLLQVMPWTGTLFAAGILALMGLPPFGLFVSEFLLVRAAILSQRLWLAGIVLLLLLTAFISLVGHLNRMLYGDAPPGVVVGERRGWAVAVLTLPVVILVALGVTLPSSISTLIHQCVATLIP